MQKICLYDENGLYITTCFYHAKDYIPIDAGKYELVKKQDVFYVSTKKGDLYFNYGFQLWGFNLDSSAKTKDIFSSAQKEETQSVYMNVKYNEYFDKKYNFYITVEEKD